ncbi:MAG: 3'(2'), 5'-bisphosphate nucleotidase [Bradymonadia bacterium]|jgi:3'(2'), 5'-bisphosphate nucleotidase
MSDFKVEIELAIELARQGGEIALEVYHREFTADQKADRSPVTEADRRVNDLICPALEAAFPDDLVIGEESGFSGEIPATGRCWFVDPIDGTKDFILKNGEWSIMIGLCVDGQAVAGVVYEPTHGRFYFAAEGTGAWVRQPGKPDKRLEAKTKPVEKAIIVNSRNHPDPRIQLIADRLGITEQFPHGSIGCKLARIAEGTADLYFNFSGRCHMWDACAAELIIREAGGALIGVEGERIVYAGPTTQLTEPFFATTRAVRESVIAAVQALADQLRPPH